MNELKKSISVADQDVLSQRAYNLRIGLNLLLGIIITAIAVVGFQNNLGLTFHTHPIIFTILFFVVTIGAELKAIQSTNTGVIYVCYAIICLTIGALLSSTVPYFSSEQILFAAASTFLILVIMIINSTIAPNAFISLGRGLFTALTAFIIAEIAMLFIFGTSFAIMDYIAIFIFSLYIGFDWARGSFCPRNDKFAVLTALCIYMDVVNIFLRLLSRSSNSKN